VRPINHLKSGLPRLLWPTLSPPRRRRLFCVWGIPDDSRGRRRVVV